ncbi:MAG: hypothetical protein JRI97_07120 [Deltaproteobacteria bacterium]|nr:hypothetical protein [Deltaproteobacteria bacterium]
MKKWKCTACGYIHTGDQPPETCPVCTAPAEEFVEYKEKEPALETRGSKTVPSPEKKPETAGESQGAAKEKPAPRPPRQEKGWRRTFSFLVRQMVAHHAHPIFVHAPSGVLPFSFILCILAALFGLEALSRSAFYALIYVLVAMPLVLFSGYMEWQENHDAKLTSLFTGKMVCGGLVTLGVIIMVGWMVNNPQVLTTNGSRGVFLLVHLGALAAGVVAGHLGGRLVFR